MIKARWAHYSKIEPVNAGRQDTETKMPLLRSLDLYHQTTLVQTSRQFEQLLQF